MHAVGSRASFASVPVTRAGGMIELQARMLPIAGGPQIGVVF